MDLWREFKRAMPWWYWPVAAGLLGGGVVLDLIVRSVQ